MNNNIQQAYEQIRKLNLIGGNLTHGDHEKTLNNIELQLNLIQEESVEAYDAFTDSDSTNLLKEACDVFVVSCGLLLGLEAAGFNVEKALARVCENNLSKLPTEHAFKVNPELQPQDTTVHTTPYGHVVFKRDDGKMMKPTNYQKVDVSSCASDELFGSIK